MGLDQVGDPGQQRSAYPADGGSDTDVELPVVLPVHAHVVPRTVPDLGGRPIGEGAMQVLGLQYLAELGDTPVADQELQSCPVPQPPVAVVAEDRDDALPDLRDLVDGRENAEPLGQHRIGGQPAAHPDVEPGAELGMDDADEGDVVDLVGDVLPGRARDGRLELAGQVGEFVGPDELVEDRLHGRRSVDDLVGRDPGERRAQHHPGHVPAGLRRAQSDAFEGFPDVGDVFDADPVQLDVLAIGQIGCVTGVLRGDLADGAERSRGQQAPVDADPQHEERILQLVRFEHRGAAAVDAGRSLRV